MAPASGRRWKRRGLLVAAWAHSIGTSAGKSPGLFLVGGSGSPDEPPVLEFGDDASATIVTAAAGALEVRREGVTWMSLDGQVAKLPHLAPSGELVAESLQVGGVPQWALWDLDTFDLADGGLWSVNERSACGAPNDLFLGGHCQFGATRTIRRYEQLPPHTRVRIRARVHFFDKWEGQIVEMQVDDSTVWAESHSWCPGFLTWMCIKFGVNTCGQDTPDRLSVKAEATIPHNAPTLSLAFSSDLALGTDACEASWGVDDVSVELL